MEVIFVLSMVVASLIMILVVLLSWIVRNILHDRERLQQENADMKRTIDDLNTMLNKRHPAHTYSTAAALEDATAVVLDIDRYTKEQEILLGAINQRKEALREILTTSREGPYSYNPDRPAGPRQKQPAAAGGAQ